MFIDGVLVTCYNKSITFSATENILKEERDIRAFNMTYVISDLHGYSIEKLKMENKLMRDFPMVKVLGNYKYVLKYRKGNYYYV